MTESRLGGDQIKHLLETMSYATSKEQDFPNEETISSYP